MKAMSVPLEFWGEAVRTAVYLLNRSPTKAVANIFRLKLGMSRNQKLAN